MTLPTPEEVAHAVIKEHGVVDMPLAVRSDRAMIAKELRNCHGLDALMEVIKELEGVKR